MDDNNWNAEQFERQRPHLRAVAYRMLGSLTEADDAVQEAWLRLNRSDSDSIDNLTAWLTTAVGRVCIDMLRARKARRENLTGTWLPEPVVSADDHHDPEQQSLLADSIGMALLVVLESLQPAERLAAAQGPRFAQHCQPALVNGAAGVIVRVGPTVVAVVGLTVIDHRIAEIDLILDPDKLAAVEISTG
jgi:RNA polymerase sigma-70 factor, ECF subfamily